MVFHFSAIQGIAGQTRNDIAFPENELPGGILQFVLFDEQMHPLSERLVFCKNYDTVQVEFHTDSATYRSREKVMASVSLTDSIGTLFTGNMSVAVTDDKDIAVDSTTTIFSTLLLSSELKGYIENPAYYLQDNRESALALDYLMLTHGWRRYNIPEVVKGNYTTPQIPFQTSEEISGQVKSWFRSKPVPGSEIVVLSKDGDLGSATSDENGAFTYSDFEYPDSTSYFVQARGKKDSRRVELVLDSVRFPPLIHAQSFVVKTPVSQEESNAFMMKAEQRSRYDSDMQVILLHEVEVTARRRMERKDEPRLDFMENEFSDMTLRRENFEKQYPLFVTDILRGIAGVMVFSNGLISIRGGGLPLVLIDGLPVDWPSPRSAIKSIYQSPLEMVSVQDVESIDIFKEAASEVIFGVRGDNGVISITTRRGIDAVREAEKMREGKVHNYAVYTPLGYQKPVEFYSPKYETLEEKQSTIPDYRTTIFWKPDLLISDTTGANFEFYTSDFPTTYSVVIEGLTDDGKPVHYCGKAAMTVK